MNYAALSAAIQDYTTNYETTFVAHIPDFVAFAEKRIYNDAELPVLRKNSTGSLSSGNQYLTLPTDWLATNSLAVIASGVQSYLLNKDVEYIREAYPDPTVQGTPKYYAQFDVNNVILGPTPDTNYSVELHYFYYPTSIVTAGNTWLGDNYDFVLLYGALREAAQYMLQEPDIVANYEKMYQDSLAKLALQAKGKLRRDTYRSMQARAEIA